MAVQAQYLARAFPHDSRAIRPDFDNVKSESAFQLDEYAGLAAAARQQVLAAAAAAGNTVFSDPRSDLTCSQRKNHCFVPRKRARFGGDDEVVMEGHRALLPPVPQPFGDVQSSIRIVGSGAASTSGRPTSVVPLQHSLLSHLYRQSVEIDALVRFENERLRLGLEDARRRHVTAVLSAVERAAARQLSAVEAELERALGRNAELDAKLQQMGAEGQAWIGMAKNHEAVAAGLRATLDQLLQSPSCAAEGEGEAEDAQSCCFVQPADAGGRDDDVPCSSRRKASCKACGDADACVLLLPCRHLCLCPECEAGAESCPVCAATKNASLHVLLP